MRRMIIHGNSYSKSERPRPDRGITGAAPSDHLSKPHAYDGGRLDLHGLSIHFDPKGHWDRKRSQFAVVDVVDAVDRIDRAKRMAVVDLPTIIEAKAQRSQHRWRVTDADREAIIADLISDRAAAQRVPDPASRQPNVNFFRQGVPPPYRVRFARMARPLLWATRPHRHHGPLALCRCFQFCRRT